MKLRKAKSIVIPSLLLVLLFLAVWGDNPLGRSPSEDAVPSQRNIIVSAEWLKQQLDSDADLMVAKVMYKGPSGAYIPGSIHINTDEIEYDLFRPRIGTPLSELERSTTEEQDQAKGLSASDSLPRNWWNLYPDEYLLKAIAHMGITVSSKVVVYSESPEIAGRLAWCLKYAGVENVHFLNGGLTAWTNTGNSTTASPAKRKPAPHFGATKPANQKYKASTEYVRGVVVNSDPSYQIVDFRTYSEFTGENDNYSYITVRGRIHNSIFGNNSDEFEVPMKGYYGENDEISLLAIDSVWQQTGITPDNQIIFYCGTGWRSSLAWLIAHDLGYYNIKNYDGGWYEWSMGPENESNPSVIGTPIYSNQTVP